MDDTSRAERMRPRDYLAWWKWEIIVLSRAAWLLWTMAQHPHTPLTIALAIVLWELGKHLEQAAVPAKPTGR